MKKPKKLRPHANQRLHERCDFAAHNLTPTEIAERINKNSITFVKKLTTSRSLGYVSINGCHFKIVYSKNTKDVVTFLPLIYDYEYIYEINLLEKGYRLIIYPDCYHEVNNPRVMTKFQRLEENQWSDLETKGEPFELLFAIAWNEYLKGKDNEKTKTENQKITTAN